MNEYLLSDVKGNLQIGHVGISFLFTFTEFVYISAMADFKKAEEIDPENADIFHHRGQVNLLTEQVDSAAEDFNKAVTLNPNFPVAYVQKLYTDYRKAMQQNDQTAVKNVINSFDKGKNKEACLK